MADFEVTSPQGQKFIVTAPEGATQAEVLSYAQANFKPKDYRGAPSPVDPTEGMSFLDKFNAGAGKAMVDMLDGGKQLFGMGPSAAEVGDRRALDAPLMRTGAGLAGNIGANLSMLAPAMLVPGAATIPAAGALGAATMALQPTETGEDRLKNMALGFGLGAGSQYAGTTGARLLGEKAAENQASALAAQSRNAVRDKTLADAQKAGYVIPPSAVNPSGANKALESFAGKAAIGQEAAVRNQPITDALARKAAGLADDQAISKTALRQSRFEASEPYRQIASISPQAAAELEALQLARQESKLQWKAYGRNADPSAFKAAQAADAQVAAAQTNLETIASQAGQPGLVEAMKNARVQLARNHEVQRALNAGTGSVDAASIGRSLDRGAPLSGELETIARFQQAFSPYARESSAVPTPGVSKVAALSSALMGGAGGAAAGPAGVAAGALPFVVPPAARSLALSQPYQQMMTRPSYSSGLLGAAGSAGLIPSPATGGLLGRTAIPAIYMGLMQPQP